MKHLLSIFLVYILCACSSLSPKTGVPAADNRGAWQTLPATTDDLKTVETFARQLPRDRTLVVFDIDDTLLTTESIGDKEYSFYGSDRWYIWQDKEVAGDAKVPGCLNELTVLNYSIMPMQATQPDAPQVVGRIPNDKLIITSRGPANWESTLRELTRAGFKLPLSPTVRSEPADFAWKENERADQVRYRDGVMLTSGFNKGVMLKEILRLSDKAYDNVILVDDTQKHLDRMKVVVEIDGMEFYGTRYTRIKDSEHLARITQPQIASHNLTYTALISLLPHISPATAAAFEKKGCVIKPTAEHQAPL